MKIVKKRESLEAQERGARMNNQRLKLINF